MSKIVIFTLIFVLSALFCDTALAATISGTVYDYSFDKVDNVNVEVNSMPKQRDITENGVYSFTLEPGNYVITAKYFVGNELRGDAEESISITKEGAYLIDLILFPTFTEEEALAEEDLVIEAEPKEEGTDYWKIAFVFLITSIFLYIVFRVLTKGKAAEEEKKVEEKESEEDLAEQVLEFIKKEGKRTTQKDIRKHFPSSEAKISLVITELEHKGKIEKIKKGRGNIIVLK